jgi:hypothetical protein
MPACTQRENSYLTDFIIILKIAPDCAATKAHSPTSYPTGYPQSYPQAATGYLPAVQ